MSMSSKSLEELYDVASLEEMYENNTFAYLQSDEADLRYLKYLSVVSSKQETNSTKTNKISKSKWSHIRTSWAQHATQLLHENMFEKEYRMPIEDWDVLLTMLRPYLKRDRRKSRSLHPITEEIICAVGMRFLYGGKKNDIRHIFKLSASECHKCVHCFQKAVLVCPNLRILMPSSKEEWETVRRGFLKKSSMGLLPGTVGAIDGFFQQTKAPSVANCRSYYSGHYESFGINCQAACDADLKFLFFGVVAAGSTNDSVAYSMAGNLKGTIDNLQLGLYFVGDAAYPVSERLLTPFTGSQRNDENRDAFNYYLSQLRIRIEMAFGLLVGKFRILKGKLEADDMRTNSKTLMSCARLHNFIIERKKLRNENNSNYETYDGYEVTENGDINVDELGFAPLPGSPLDMVYCPTIPDDDIFDEVVGESQTRDAIVQIVTDNEIRRPDFNVERNASGVDVRAAHVAIPLNDRDRNLFLDYEFYHPHRKYGRLTIFHVYRYKIKIVEIDLNSDKVYEFF